MDEFGALAIPTKKNLKDGVITMAGTVSSTAASKRNLRALGKVLGVVPKGGASFKLSAEEICTMIKESGDPRFINLEKMSDEEVAAITEELGGGEEGEEAAAPAAKPEPAKPAPAAAKPAPAPKAAAKPAAKPAPVEEEEVEEEEEPAPKRPVRQPVRTAEPTEPARQPDAGVRRPVPRQVATPAATSAGAPSADLSELREMVLLIGKTGDARDVVLKKLSAAVENLTEKIEAIDGYLAFRYSEEAGPGNEIKSLTEVSWR
jgi:outer membrane biosynthesis protein TonB